MERFVVPGIAVFGITLCALLLSTCNDTLRFKDCMQHAQSPTIQLTCPQMAGQP